MGRPRKVGKCPQHLPNDQKCNGCQRGRGCTGMPPVATELDLATESTSEPPRPQPFADTDEHEVPSMCDQPKRKRKAPERFEVDANITSRATGQRWSAQSCCPNHMDAEPSTSEPAPKPKFTGPMDKYLSDKRVEAAVNRAVKSITDNPADLERELRDFAQAGEDWRQKSMTLEQENEAIRKKLDKVTKELEKVMLRTATSERAGGPRTKAHTGRRSSTPSSRWCVASTSTTASTSRARSGGNCTPTSRASASTKTIASSRRRT